jgi:hypothetical protein
MATSRSHRIELSDDFLGYSIVPYNHQAVFTPTNHSTITSDGVRSVVQPNDPLQVGYNPINNPNNDPINQTFDYTFNDYHVMLLDNQTFLTLFPNLDLMTKSLYIFDLSRYTGFFQAIPQTGVLGDYLPLIGITGLGNFNSVAEALFRIENFYFAHIARTLFTASDGYISDSSISIVSSIFSSI